MIRKFVLILLLLIGNFAYAEDFENEDSFTPASEPTITDLTDKIEKLEHKNHLLEKKLEALASDVEYRFKELENKATLSKTTGDKPSKKKAEADPKQAKVQFENALVLLQDEQYEEAEQAFTQFVSDYPNNAYTGNAYYWLGESFMLSKRYDKAAVNYLQSFSKYPKNDKADLSMLKLSSALNMLGKKKEACAMLTKLKAKKDKLNQSVQKLLQKELKQSSCSKTQH